MNFILSLYFLPLCAFIQGNSVSFSLSLPLLPAFFISFLFTKSPFFVLLFPGEEMWQVAWRQVQARRFRYTGKYFGGGGEACGRAAE